MLLPFSKYSGCGNDFILFDNKVDLFPKGNIPFIRKICDRQQGIGADGVVLLEPSFCAHHKMRIFNADGSEAEMCGNGIRCLMHFLLDLGYPKQPYHIETKERILSLSYIGQSISVDMGKATDEKFWLPLMVDGSLFEIYTVNTGVPHAVAFVENLEEMDVVGIGSKIRHHPFFSPMGTNVNFANIVDQNTLRIRTYERGVENETLACGTGATAAALAAFRIHCLQSPVSVYVRSKERITICFTFQNNKFENIKMIGPTTFISKGKISFESSLSFQFE